MKKLLFSLIALCCFASMHAQDLKTQNDSLSYSIGVLIGQNLKKQGLTKIDPAVFTKAIQDVTSGGTTKIDPTSANKLVSDFTAKEKANANKKNIEEGADFLETNGKRPGVVTLPSGLQYEVLTEGTGPVPTASDKVKVHYTGTLINGTVFDSSVERGEPIVFPVTGVIKGWIEALQLMKVGSKWKLFIPQNLAYGERGAGAQIGPFATLIFEVELLGIEK